MSTLTAVLAIIIATMGFSSCGMSGKPAVDNEKEYPEALFTLGEIATVELKISDDTWKNITTKASDKEYYQCAVTINGERFDSVAIRVPHQFSDR